MLTVVGVAAIALVVDLMTVTLRRAALAGLPLLALFTVCAATGHHGVKLLSFISSAVGYLWLLYADNRDKVTRWGAAIGSGSRARPASAWSTDPSSAPPPASLGRQVGAAAISLGLLVPVFIPGLHTGIGKRGGGGTGTGSGGGVVHTFNPIARIGAQLAASKATTVMRYTTTSSNPGYIRLTSLDQFDGTSFTERSLTAGANQAAGNNLPVQAPPGPTVQTTFDVASNFVVHWLPIETTAVGVSLGEPWRYDPGTSTIFSAAATTGGIHFDERSVPNEPSPAELAAAPKPQASLDADLTLPTITPPVRVLEREITKGAKSRFEAALDIQKYLTGPDFHYDTSVPADRSDQALYNFLFNNQRGFCQQFATAMAVLARLHGIPSRVAVGFTAGKKLPGTDTWDVTTKDAHAWPELWFQGYGWLAFEPTPRGDGQAVPPSYAVHLPGSGNGGKNNNSDVKSTLPHKGQGATKPHGKNKTGQTVGAAGQNNGGSGPSGSLLWVLLFLLAAAAIVPGLARGALRRRRWRIATDPARAPAVAWAELRDTVIDRGLTWDDRRSPRQIATALLYALEAAPKTCDSMLRLARYEEQSRYAAGPSKLQANLRYDVEIVRAAIDADRPRLKRAWSAILPRSTTLRTRASIGRTADRLQAMRRRFSPVAFLRARLGVTGT
ncbi:MAG: transglutaminase domain-containing protein [Frankiaceae bacterium]|nr:transglutaminase domain-containing protein [Frankiaceae bacterium]